MKTSHSFLNHWLLTLGVIMATNWLLIGGTFIGCGSSSATKAAATTTTTAAGDASLALTITEPASASISSSSGLMKGVVRLSAITDAIPPTGTTVTANDTTGTALTNVTCPPTDADGKTTCTGFTEAQLDAGVVMVAEGTSITHSFIQIPTATTLANVAAATVPTGDINGNTDFAFAATDAALTEAGATFASPGTIDVNQLNTTTRALADQSTDLTATDSTKDVAALVLAHKTALINGSDAVAETTAALGGDTTTMVTDVGETVGDEKVSVAYSAANVATLGTRLVATYCTKDADGNTPLTGVEDAAGTDVDLRTAFFAAIGPMATMTPTEIKSVSATDFQNYITGLTSSAQVKTAMTAFATNPTAIKTYKEQMLQGSYATAANAGPAFGFAMASFPMTTAGDFSTLDTTKMATFDYASAARAAFNTMGTYVAGATAGKFASADAIFTGWNATMKDNLSACATGGTTAFGSAMNTYLAGGTLTSSSISFKSAGASCTDDTNCLPNARCTGGTKAGTCTAITFSDGASCNSNADCAVTEYCMGTVKKYCMFAGGMFTGAPVYTSATSTTPVFYGGTGTSDIAITSGTNGAICNQAKTLCATGYSCSGVKGTGGSNGICYKSLGVAGLQYGIGFPCQASTDCYSGSCSNQICAFTSAMYSSWSAGTTASGTSIGTPPKEAGFACTMPRDCLSYNCTGGVCSDTAISTSWFGTATTSLKAKGASCTDSKECASFFCAAGVCGMYAGENMATATTTTTTTPTAGTVAKGGACTYTGQCSSVGGLSCLEGTCQSFTYAAGTYTGTTLGTTTTPTTGTTTTTPTTGTTTLVACTTCTGATPYCVNNNVLATTTGICVVNPPLTTTTTTPTSTTLAAGAACTVGSTTSMCAPGVNCVGTPSTCRTVLALGATCSLSSTTTDCGASNSCVSGTCQVPVASSPYAHLWNITSATNMQPPLTIGMTTVTVNCTGNPGPCTVGGLSGSNTIKISQFNSGAGTCSLAAGSTTTPPACTGGCTLGGPKTGAAGTTMTATGCNDAGNGNITLTAP